MRLKRILDSYHLIDAGDLRLEDCDCVSNGGLLVHLRSSSESLCRELSDVLLLVKSCEELRQHSRAIIY